MTFTNNPSQTSLSRPLGAADDATQFPTHNTTAPERATDQGGNGVIKMKPRISFKGNPIILSIDTAAKPSEFNSYTVCTVWQAHSDGYYLLDVYRKRPNAKELVDDVEAIIKKRRPQVVLIEDASNGSALADFLEDKTPKLKAKIKRILPKGRKADRWFEATYYFSQGLVFIPNKASWKETYENEILSYPNTRFSDQVDSTSQFLNWIEGKSLAPALDPSEPLGRAIKLKPGMRGPNRVLDRNGLPIAFRPRRHRTGPRKHIILEPKK